MVFLLPQPVVLAVSSQPAPTMHVRKHTLVTIVYYLISDHQMNPSISIIVLYWLETFKENVPTLCTLLASTGLVHSCQLPWKGHPVLNATTC